MGTFGDILKGKNKKEDERRKKRQREGKKVKSGSNQGCPSSRSDFSSKLKSTLVTSKKRDDHYRLGKVMEQASQVLECGLKQVSLSLLGSKHDLPGL